LFSEINKKNPKSLPFDLLNAIFYLENQVHYLRNNLMKAYLYNCK